MMWFTSRIRYLPRRFIMNLCALVLMQQHKLRSVTSDDDANRWEMRFSSAFYKQKGNLMIHLYSLAQCDSTQLRSFTFFSSSLRIVSKIVIGRVLHQKDSFQLKVWVYLDVWMMTQRRRVIGLEFNLFELSSIVSRELCSVMWFLFSWIRLLKQRRNTIFIISLSIWRKII